MRSLRVLVLVGTLTSLPAPAADEPLPAGAALRIGQARWQLPASGSFAFAPDGKSIAVTGGAGGEVAFWDAGTGATTATWTGTVGSPAAYTRDGKGVLLNSGGTLHLWDVATGKEIQKFGGDGRQLAEARVSPDGKWLAAEERTQGKATFHVWDLATGKRTFTGTVELPELAGLAFAHDGATVAALAQDGRVSLWATATGKELGRLGAANKEMASDGALAFRPDGKTLVAVCGDQVAVWDLATKEATSRAKLPTWARLLTPDGKWLVVPEGPSGLAVWDVAAMKPARAVPFRPGSFSSMTLSPDGGLLAWREGNRLRVWATETGKELSASAGHPARITDLRFLDGGRGLFAASADGSARLWDVPAGTERRRYESLLRPTVSADGRVGVAYGGPGPVVFDVATGRQLALLKDAPAAFALSPDGRRLYTLTQAPASALRVWDVAHARQVAEYPLPGARRLGVVLVAPDGKSIAVGGATDDALHLIDAATGKATGTTAGLPLLFSPGGKLALVDDRHVLHVGDIVRPCKSPPAAAFDPDGKTLAVGDADGIVLLDAKTGKEVGRKVGHGKRGVSVLAFSPDGEWLASGSDDATILLWSLGSAAGEPLPDGAVVRIGSDRWRAAGARAFTWSPDGKTVALSLPREIRLLDATTGEGRGVIAGPGIMESLAFTPDGQALVGPAGNGLWQWRLDGQAGQQFTVADGPARQGRIVLRPIVSPDGRLVAGVHGPAFNGPRVVVWERATGKELCAVEADPKLTTALAFSPDSAMLATLGEAGDLVVWKAATGKEVARLAAGRHTHRAHLAFIDSKLIVGVVQATAIIWDLGERIAPQRGPVEGTPVALSGDGRWIATAVGQGPARQLALWGVVEGKRVRLLEGQYGRAVGVRFSPDGRHLAALGEGGRVTVWNAATGDDVSRSAGHAGAIRSLAFAADGKSLLSTADDDTARAWDLPTGRLARQINVPGTPFDSPTLTGDGKYILAAGVNGGAVVHDIANGDRVSLRPAGRVGAVSPDGKTLAVPGREGGVELWDVATAKQRATVALPGQPVAGLRFSADGKHLAADGADAAGNEVVHVIDPAGGKALHALPGRLGAFGPKGDVLVAVDRAGTLLVYDVEKGAKVQSAELHLASIEALAVSPDGRYVAVGRENGVLLWDRTGEGRVAARLFGHDGKVAALAFSSDGKRLASGGGDTTIVVWDLERVGK